MTESGSHDEPCTSSGVIFSMMLWKVSDRFHRLGGLASAA
jgi:hypothetical protein